MSDCGFPYTLSEDLHGHVISEMRHCIYKYKYHAEKTIEMLDGLSFKGGFKAGVVRDVIDEMEKLIIYTDRLIQYANSNGKIYKLKDKYPKGNRG